MTIFAVIPLPKTNQPRLKQLITDRFSDSHYDLGSGSWLISFNGTAKGLTEKLGIVGAEEVTIHAALVLEISSYYGRADPAIWSWISTKWNEAANG